MARGAHVLRAGIAIVAVAAAIGALISGAGLAILLAAVVLALVIVAGLIKRRRRAT